jgi:hypothetical protein
MPAIRPTFYLRACFALVPSLLFAAPSNDDERYRIMDEADLRQLVDAHYQARAKKDWVAFYKMASPDFRRCTDEREFTEDTGIPDGFEILSWKIKKLQGGRIADESLLESDCLDAPLVFESAAEVHMILRTRYRGGQIDVDKRMVDIWLYVDGRWYWHDYAWSREP